MRIKARFINEQDKVTNHLCETFLITVCSKGSFGMVLKNVNVHVFNDVLKYVFFETH